MHEPARLLPRHPARSGNGDPPVERGRDFVGHERALPRHPRAPGLVLAPRLERVGELDLDPGLTEPLGATGHLRIGIEGADHDSTDAGGHDGVDAGRRRSALRAGLERHVERATARAVPGGAKRVDFGVRLTSALVPPFADDRSGPRDDDRTDDRVRMGRAAAVLRQLDRAVEVVHNAAARMRRYAAAGSASAKIALPQTSRLAPASWMARAFVSPTPPSTWTGTSTSLLTSAIRSSASGMNAWPE